MARLIVFFCVVALAVAGALVIISERAAATHAGYRVARLESERRRLIEHNRHLEARVAQLRAPGALAERVKGLQLDLLPPDRWVEQRLAAQKEKDKASAASPRTKTAR